MTHTPTPWILEPNDPFVYALNEKGSNRMSIHIQGGHTDDGKRTTREELVANAEFIHSACNAHDELVTILKEADRLYSSYGLLAQSSECGEWINAVRKALSNAEKGTQL